METPRKGVRASKRLETKRIQTAALNGNVLVRSSTTAEIILPRTVEILPPVCNASTAPNSKLLFMIALGLSQKEGTENTQIPFKEFHLHNRADKSDRAPAEVFPAVLESPSYSGIGNSIFDLSNESDTESVVILSSDEDEESELNVENTKKRQPASENHISTEEENIAESMLPGTSLMHKSSPHLASSKFDAAQHFHHYRIPPKGQRMYSNTNSNLLPSSSRPAPEIITLD